MAELQTEEPGSGGKVRAKKRSTKIDMTPMVDLAFLLLTFFILTTSFKKPYVLEVVMPEPVSDIHLMPISDKDVLNVVLAKDDKIYWWIGLTPPVRQTNYSSSGIRRILLEKRSNPRLMVLIKAMDDSRFQNMVDMLDEVEITKVPRYAIVDYEDEDSAMIADR